MFQVPAHKEDGMFTDLGGMLEKRKVQVFLYYTLEKMLQKKTVEETPNQTTRDYLINQKIHYDTMRFLSHSLALYAD